MAGDQLAKLNGKEVLSLANKLAKVGTIVFEQVPKLFEKWKSLRSDKKKTN